MKYCHIGAVLVTVFFVLDWCAISVLSGAPDGWLPLFIIAFLPVITSCCLRSPIEFLAGFYLLVACASTSTQPPFGFFTQLPNAFPLLGLIFMLLGLWDEVEFRRIVKGIEDFL